MAAPLAPETIALVKAASDEIVGAWAQAYWFLADILIGKEADLHAELESARAVA